MDIILQQSCWIIDECFRGLEEKMIEKKKRRKPKAKKSGVKLSLLQAQLLGVFNQVLKLGTEDVFTPVFEVDAKERNVYDKEEINTSGKKKKKDHEVDRYVLIPNMIVGALLPIIPQKFLFAVFDGDTILDSTNRHAFLGFFPIFGPWVSLYQGGFNRPKVKDNHRWHPVADLITPGSLIPYLMKHLHEVSSRIPKPIVNFGENECKVLADIPLEMKRYIECELGRTITLESLHKSHPHLLAIDSINTKASASESNDGIIPPLTNIDSRYFSSPVFIPFSIPSERGFHMGEICHFVLGPEVRERTLTLTKLFYFMENQKKNEHLYRPRAVSNSSYEMDIKREWNQSVLQNSRFSQFFRGEYIPVDVEANDDSKKDDETSENSKKRKRRKKSRKEMILSDPDTRENLKIKRREINTGAFLISSTNRETHSLLKTGRTSPSGCGPVRSDSYRHDFFVDFLALFFFQYSVGDRDASLRFIDSYLLSRYWTQERIWSNVCGAQKINQEKIEFVPDILSIVRMRSHLLVLNDKCGQWIETYWKNITKVRKVGSGTKEDGSVAETSFIDYFRSGYLSLLKSCDFLFDAEGCDRFWESATMRGELMKCFIGENLPDCTPFGMIEFTTFLEILIETFVRSELMIFVEKFRMTEKAYYEPVEGETEEMRQIRTKAVFPFIQFHSIAEQISKDIEPFAFMHEQRDEL